jgi:hypothetical protein
MTDPLAQCRDDLLDEAEAAGWPELVEPGMACILGELEWRAHIESATGSELVAVAAFLMHIERDDNELETESQ